MPLPCFERRRKQLDFFYLVAEISNDLRESFLRLIISTLPHRRFDERKHRRQRRFFGGNLNKRNARPWARVGIILVVIGDLLRKQCDIFNRTRKQPDVIECARQRKYSVSRNQSVGRLETDHTAISGRSNRRTIRLTSKRERHHGCGNSRRRTARRPAGSMLGVVRIARFSGKKK